MARTGPIAIFLLAAAVALNAQCLALCRVAPCADPAVPAEAADCHHGKPASDAPKDEACGHHVCVSEESQPAVSPAVVESVSAALAPEPGAAFPQPVHSAPVEDASPPGLFLSCATLLVLRI
jgi:hypothetical protein